MSLSNSYAIHDWVSSVVFGVLTTSRKKRKILTPTPRMCDVVKALNAQQVVQTSIIFQLLTENKSLLESLSRECDVGVAMDASNRIVADVLIVQTNRDLEDWVCASSLVS